MCSAETKKCFITYSYCVHPPYYSFWNWTFVSVCTHNLHSWAFYSAFPTWKSIVYIIQSEITGMCGSSQSQSTEQLCVLLSGKLVRAIDTQKPASTTLLNDRRINFSCGLWLRCHPSHCVKSNQTLAQAGSWRELAPGDRESSRLMRNKECYVLLCQLMKRRADIYLQRQAQTWALWGLMLNQHYSTDAFHL